MTTEPQEMRQATFRREWAMPNSETFDILPIRLFVGRYLGLSMVSVDPFARNSRLATHTNDLNPGTSADYHMEAATFLELLLSKGVQADVILFDPPYSPRQTKEVYQSIGKHFGISDQQNVGRWTKEREFCARLMKPSGVCLSFGWNSQGLGKQNGFEITEVLIVCHGGAHNDTICIAERRIETTPDLFPLDT
jgi:hypothetical protein